MFLRSPAGGEAATGEGNMSEMFCLIVFVFCFHCFYAKFGKWQKTAVGIMNRGLALLFRAGPCGREAAGRDLLCGFSHGRQAAELSKHNQARQYFA